jgi:REP element-mobilizing transposase RayT
MEIPNHFPHFYLDAFVVMPNHLHGIVMIEKPYIDNNSSFVETETGHTLSLQQKNMRQANEDDLTLKHPRFRNQGRNTISSMAGSFKSAVTRYCNENKLQFGWQSRFHDHIIRDEAEFNTTSNYIINNVANWKNDRFYTEPGLS